MLEQAQYKEFPVVQICKVSAEDCGIRLDRWFQRHFPEFSYGALQKAMRKGSVRLDKKRVKGSVRVITGQEVRVPPIPKQSQNNVVTFSSQDRNKIKSWLIYQDEEIIAINKPSGVAVQGGSGQSQHLDKMVGVLQENRKHKPLLVHRLDKDTSGVIIFARSPAVAQWLSECFAKREVSKTYWALVTGKVKKKQATITMNVKKQQVGMKEKMVKTTKGVASKTSYSLVAASRSASWLELRPQTGRKHQLRLHCQQMNHPIVGDLKYGGSAALLPKSFSSVLHLHSRSIQFTTPNGRKYNIQASPPPHILASFQALKFPLPSNLENHACCKEAN